MHFDLAVIGAGVAGLALAYEGSKLGAACAVIEELSEPSFASVRNQGWLHSGALYALYGSTDLAADCLRSSVEVEALASGHGTRIVTPNPGVAFFDSSRQAEAFVERTARCGISTKPIDLSDLSEVGKTLTEGPYHNVAVEIPDRAIANSEFLSLLLELARRGGTRFFVSNDPPTTWQIKRAGDVWEIKAGRCSIEATTVVIAAGVKSPELAFWFFGHRLSHRIKNCYVMAFPGLRTDRLYISPNPQTGLLNVAPYSMGTTVNCGAHDIDSYDSGALDIEMAVIRRVHESLALNWPALLRLGPKVITYICQKLNFPEVDARDQRSSYFREIDVGAHIFYPGKLTLALSGARALSERLFESVRTRSDASSGELQTALAYSHPGSANASLNLADIWAL